MYGYMHSAYAQSLAEFGTPQELSACGGWVLKRQIPGFPYYDAMGCYPLFACRDWSKLSTDLKNVSNEWVSLALVADPFGRFELACLQECFEVVIPFKEHLIADLSQPMNVIVTKHHRYYARRALRDVQVEVCPYPENQLDEWVKLYANLIERHNITGTRAFSREAFAKQLSIPGMVLVIATSQGVTVGANLICVQDEVAYTHLSAFSPRGYELRAAYAVRWVAIEYLMAQKICWLDLGAGVGIENNGTDGLSEFKRGWSTGTRPAYFCGCIFNPQRYTEIVQAKGIPATDYFPAYRQGEFS